MTGLADTELNKGFIARIYEVRMDELAGFNLTDNHQLA
jgi:hypothetical protein